MLKKATNALLFLVFFLALSTAQAQEWSTNEGVNSLVADGILAGISSVHVSGDRVLISGLRTDFTGYDVYYSDDNGATWTNSISDSAIGSFAVFANGSGDILYSYGSDLFGGRFMRKSEDRGESWTTLTPDGTNFPLIFIPIHMVSTGNAILLTSSGANATVLKSTDEGATWSSFTNFAGTEEAKDLADLKTKDQYFYMASNDGGLYRSQEAAMSWELVRAFDNSANEALFDILVDDLTGRIYITTRAGLEYSDDDGATWTLLSAEMLGVGEGTPDGLVFLGDELMLQMANGANSRMLIIQGLISSTTINDGLGDFGSEGRFLTLDFTSTSVFGIRIGQESSLWQFGAGITTSREENEEAASSFVLHQNYPNPFNPSTNITFTMSQPGIAKIVVYNALGQHVAILGDGFYTTGQHVVRFDAAHLPAGIYLYKLEAKGTNQVRRMTYIK